MPKLKGKPAAELKEEMLTTTISLPASLYKRLKHLAVDAETTVRGLIREAVEDFLARKEKGGSKR